jgi:antitoxin YefM
MAIQTTYTQARAYLADLWDRAVEDRETIVIERRGSEAVVLISADELASLLETAHLLRSLANAERLLRPLERARHGTEPPAAIEALRRDLGLAKVG